MSDGKQSDSTTPQARRTILHTYPLPQLPGWESRMVLLEYPPNCVAPPHNHPVAGINYVIEGTVESQWDGGEVETFHTGETFMDWPDQTHLRVANPSSTEWFRVVVNYVIKTGEPNVTML